MDTALIFRASGLRISLSRCMYTRSWFVHDRIISTGSSMYVSVLGEEAGWIRAFSEIDTGRSRRHETSKWIPQPG